MDVVRQPFYGYRLLAPSQHPDEKSRMCFAQSYVKLYIWLMGIVPSFYRVSECVEMMYLRQVGLLFSNICCRICPV